MPAKKTSIESKLKPPSELKVASEKRIFKSIINAYSGDFFNEGDIPMLVNYVRLKSAADKCHTEYSTNGEIITINGTQTINPYYNLFMKTVERMNSVAQKLRIAPSARMRQEAPRSSATKARSGSSFNPAADWRDHQNK